MKYTVKYYRVKYALLKGTYLPFSAVVNHPFQMDVINFSILYNYSPTQLYPQRVLTLVLAGKY